MSVLVRSLSFISLTHTVDMTASFSVCRRRQGEAKRKFGVCVCVHGRGVGVHVFSGGQAAGGWTRVPRGDRGYLKAHGT